MYRCQWGPLSSSSKQNLTPTPTLLMELQLDPTCLTWSASISSTTPITRSTKFLNDTPKLTFSFRVESLKRSSKPQSPGLQKDPKKDLSRILRTEAAIKGVEKKANSWKHRQLWPKAVLEALDEAINGLRWQAALKVRPIFNFFKFFFFWLRNFILLLRLQ